MKLERFKASISIDLKITSFLYSPYNDVISVVLRTHVFYTATFVSIVSLVSFHSREKSTYTSTEMCWIK